MPRRHSVCPDSRNRWIIIKDLWKFVIEINVEQYGDIVRVASGGDFNTFIYDSRISLAHLLGDTSDRSIEGGINGNRRVVPMLLFM